MIKVLHLQLNHISVRSKNDETVSLSILHNDDMLFWLGKQSDNVSFFQLLRSLIRPVILPLMLPCHLQLTSQNVESTSTYSVVCTHQMNHLLRDFIRLRLAFNFQFEKVLMDFCLNSRRFLISVRTMLQ